MGFLHDFSPQASTKNVSQPKSTPVAPASNPSKPRGFVTDFGHSRPTQDTYQPAVREEYVQAYEEPDRFVPRQPENREEEAVDTFKLSSGFSTLGGTSPVRAKRSTPSRRRKSTTPTIQPRNSTGVSASGLKSRLDELNSRAREAGSRIRSAESRRDSLKTEYSQKLDQLRSAKDQLSVLRAREDQTEEKLSRQSGLVKRLERKLSAAMGWGSDYHSSSLDFELSDLNLTYQDGKMNSDSRWRLRDFLDGKRNQQSQLSSSLSNTRDAIRNCEQRIKQLESQLQQISSEQEQASRRSESSQKQKSALELELQNLQDRHYQVAGTFY